MSLIFSIRFHFILSVKPQTTRTEVRYHAAKDISKLSSKGEEMKES